MREIYLSGPMSGVPELNGPAFREAARVIREAHPDWELISPFEMDTYEDVTTWTWKDYMRRDIEAILYADAIALLPGWMSSRGARLEHHVAREMGLDIYFMISDGDTFHLVKIADGDPTVDRVPTEHESIHDLGRGWAGR